MLFPEGFWTGLLVREMLFQDFTHCLMKNCSVLPKKKSLIIKQNKTKQFPSGFTVFWISGIENPATTMT